MNCERVRGLFGVCWDDETTHAEREQLESHFAACDRCRREYEDYSRVLETAGLLSRVEPAPDLVDRVLARTRRVVAVPDAGSGTRPLWLPATAAAALIVLAGAALVSGIRRPSEISSVTPATIRVPVLVRPRVATGPVTLSPSVGAVPLPGVAGGAMATLPDKLFDHSEDVEFILDPVRLRRGHAHAVTSAPAGVRVERAVVSF